MEDGLGSCGRGRKLLARLIRYWKGLIQKLAYRSEGSMQVEESTMRTRSELLRGKHAKKVGEEKKKERRDCDGCRAPFLDFYDFLRNNAPSARILDLSFFHAILGEGLPGPAHCSPVQRATQLPQRLTSYLERSRSMSKCYDITLYQARAKHELWSGVGGPEDQGSDCQKYH